MIFLPPSEVQFQRVDEGVSPRSRRVTRGEPEQSTVIPDHLPRHVIRGCVRPERFACILHDAAADPRVSPERSSLYRVVRPAATIPPAEELGLLRIRVPASSPLTQLDPRLSWRRCRLVAADERYDQHHGQPHNDDNEEQGQDVQAEDVARLEEPALRS